MSGWSELPNPGDELEAIISGLTPPGALIWRTLPASLPWTQPPRALRGARPRKPSSDTLLSVLAEMGIAPKAAQLLLAGPYSQLGVYGPREFARNHGLPGRAVEVAAEIDIAGSDILEVADRLDLSDHRVGVSGSAGTVSGDARGARRYLGRGRRLLAGLGVWPWAHVERWHPARPWWRDQAVLNALLDWHDKAWIAAAEDLAWARGFRSGRRSWRALTIQEASLCRQLRDDLDGLSTNRSPSDGTRSNSQRDG